MGLHLQSTDASGREAVKRVNATNKMKGGQTALWMQCCSGRSPQHQAPSLGIPGVDVNLQSERGYTALRIAAFKGAWRCVKVRTALSSCSDSQAST